MTRRWLLALLLTVAPASAQTVTPAQNGSGYYAVYQAYPANALTGTTSETNQAAIRIPANTLGPSGVIRITAFWSCTNSANNKTITIRFNATSGATSGGQMGVTTQTTVATMHGMMVVRNAGATNSQTTYGSFLAPFGTSASAVVVNNIDTTADSFVNINGTLALGTETMTLLSYVVEVTHL